MSKERTEKTRPSAAEITGLSVDDSGSKVIGTRSWQESTTVCIVTISHFIMYLQDWTRDTSGETRGNASKFSAS